MVAQIIARAAVKQAAKKQAAKTATKKAAARGAKAGDATYNTRRRFARSGMRNLKKAEASSGATAARYREMARLDLESALQTYEKGTTQKFSKNITTLADELGINLEERREFFRDTSSGSDKQRMADLAKRSKRTLETSFQDEDERRQRNAYAVFSGNVGSRIIGGLSEVWEDKALTYDEFGNAKIDRKKLFSAIYDYFGVDNMADLLAKIEEKIGSMLYKNVGEDEWYETVKLTLQGKIADGSLVA